VEGRDVVAGGGDSAVLIREIIDRDERCTR
jgi:hypothetical protein